MKQLIIVLISCLWCWASFGQQVNTGYLNHLEVSASIGTTGVGLDLSAPLGEHFGVRAGFAYMPKMKFPLSLRMSLEDGYEEMSYSELSAQGQSKKMKQLLGMLSDLTGIKADAVVDIHLVPGFYNGKMLVDWKPLSGCKWYVTAGVFFGSSRVGEAYNYDEETAFMMAINGFNHIYDNVKNQKPIIEVGDNYVDFSPKVNNKILSYGHASFYIGPKNDGSYYHSFPTAEGKIRVDAYVNRVKPYLGTGYGWTLGQSGRCNLAVEMGALFWGGKARLITHDGVDLAHDMAYIKKGTLRDLVNHISILKVYPVLEARLSWRIY